MCDIGKIQAIVNEEAPKTLSDLVIRPLPEWLNPNTERVPVLVPAKK